MKTIITQRILNKAYQHGYEAYVMGVENNPYNDILETELYNYWMNGWWDAYNDEDWDLRNLAEEEYEYAES